jgi:GT2 family glycosyltransferase
VLDRAAWHRVRPIPEEFFLYMEDVALGYLANAQKVQVYVLGSARVEQAANGPSRYLAVRNRTILAYGYMNVVERALVMFDIHARTMVFRFRRDPRRVENERALTEGRRIGLLNRRKKRDATFNAS